MKSTPTTKLVITESTRYPGELSLRTHEGGQAGSISTAMKAAGFKVGDHVVLTKEMPEKQADGKDCG